MAFVTWLKFILAIGGNAQLISLRDDVLAATFR